MAKVLVVYWSGTGNTEIMAEKIAAGIENGGASVDLKRVDEISADDIEKYDKVAFGCPAMGDEVLEEEEFEPFFEEAETLLSDKKVALFGSYDWGDGEWMRLWEDRTKANGAKLFQDEGLIVHNTPDADAEDECLQFGEKFANF